MSADKHPADVLADWHDSAPYVPNSFGHKTAEQLRRIQALEAELDEARRTVRMAHELGTAIAAERDQLRAEVEALREANSTFATAAILPDDKVIVDKAEIEALREDAELYRWILVNYARGDGFTAVDAALNDGMANEQLTPAIKAAREQQ